MSISDWISDVCSSDLTLTIEEHNHVVDICIKAAAGRVPVIAGCGSNDTVIAALHMKHAKEAGAAAALVVTPYYNRPNQDGLYRHFAYLAEQSDLPLIIYNLPGRPAVDMTVATMARLAADYPTLHCVTDPPAPNPPVLYQRHHYGPHSFTFSGITHIPRVYHTY